MRSALIIGAGGQDGRLLARQLLGQGYAVRGWTRAVPLVPAPCACESIDLLNSAQVRDQLQILLPDEIYYLAAFHHSTEDSIDLSSVELLRRSRAVHVEGLSNVLAAITSVCPEARLFYAASSHVFGAPTADLLDETAPFEPISAYGISKAEGIECCRRRRRDGVYAASGILFNHESSLRRPTFLSQKVVQGALRARRDPTTKLILGDLDAQVDWGYAPDYVDAMVRLLQLPEPSDFIVATGQLHSVRDFAQIAFATVGLDWQRHVQTHTGLLKRKASSLCGDSGKLRAATGWHPTISFAEMVAKLVQEAESSLDHPTSSVPLPSLFEALATEEQRSDAA